VDDALEVARQAEVKRLALFHHDPMRADEDVERFEASARGVFGGAFAAREGETVSL
jgi:ribonuclease BN (tRNA processing enzyme)